MRSSACTSRRDIPSGVIGYRSGAGDGGRRSFRINVHGKQTHGAMPWLGVDPIVVASQIVLALQTIVSRQLDISREPSVVTVGAIHGGVRNNIIPDEVEMLGTIRTFDEKMRDDIHERIKRTAQDIATSGGATADVSIETGYPVTYNDPTLTEKMAPTFRRDLRRTSCRQPVPGCRRLFVLPAESARDSSSGWERDPRTESRRRRPRITHRSSTSMRAACALGVRAMSHVAVDYLRQRSACHARA